MARNDRDRDEVDLYLVRARSAGIKSTQLGARFGMTPANVRIATTRIRAADIAESGEPPDAVASAYWRR